MASTLSILVLCAVALLRNGLRPEITSSQVLAAASRADKAGTRARAITGWAVEGVCLDEWTGRFGNQVVQVQQALMAARTLGLTYIRLPRKDPGTIRKILRLEDRVWHLGQPMQTASTEMTVECAAVCDMWQSCGYANGTRMPMPEAWDTPEPELLHNLITKTGRLRCDELDEFRHGDDKTLTMHIRSGDTICMTYDSFGYHRAAPCEFWTQAFAHGNFSSALIVTEHDHIHPCIDVIEKAFPGQVTVQRGSELQDFCTIMHAHSLAVSFSSIDTSLVELSPTIHTLYSPTWVSSKVFGRSSSLEPKCIEMSFAGYPDKFESWEQKKEYLVSFPASGVSFAQRPCEQWGNHWS